LRALVHSYMYVLLLSLVAFSDPRVYRGLIPALQLQVSNYPVPLDNWQRTERVSAIAHESFLTYMDNPPAALIGSVSQI
jgi:hypothetical protein